jgi:hypothetical protein
MFLSTKLAPYFTIPNDTMSWQTSWHLDSLNMDKGSVEMMHVPASLPGVRKTHSQRTLPEGGGTVGCVEISLTGSCTGKTPPSSNRYPPPSTTNRKPWARFGLAAKEMDK